MKDHWVLFYNTHKHHGVENQFQIAGDFIPNWPREEIFEEKDIIKEVYYYNHKKGFT